VPKQNQIPPLADWARVALVRAIEIAQDVDLTSLAALLGAPAQIRGSALEHSYRRHMSRVGKHIDIPNAGEAKAMFAH